ncbi:terminal nucleotidyltransferase 4A-like [Eriocheir sinensis]|uniref:terminal nucleotidyltransferase 4A-like n=1 Tax=Eriocheir sinensis TaxID=95602 RepID=UPI0021C855FE|nr:terminal nucleotidyltransferase 4A-like [Eriocheir sinensis]
MLAALAAVASSPPSRREGGEETGLDVTPPDKGGDEEKQEETHLEEVKECVQEGPRDTETPAATGMEAVPRPPPPWDCPPKCYDGSRRALHQELLDFHRWAGGSDAEYQRRLRPVEDLRRVVVTMWPQVRVEATGSLANGLYMADSDVDATLLGHCGRAWRLGQLTVLEKTTVPLVKFVHQATGLPVDVSLGSEAAVRAAELVRELLRRFPALAPISLLVRHYLRGLGLAEVFTGGVSSYAVTLMVTSFLQLQIPPDAQHDLGWLLVSFFAFYGYEFNFASTGISVVGRGRYLRKEDVPIVMPRGHRRADLCIQDPLCPTNDLGRSSFRVWDVRRAFQHAYRVLEAALFEPGVYASPCSLLGQLLARHATPQRVLPKWTPPPVPAATGASRTAYEQKKQEAEHRSKHRPGQTRKDDFKKPEQAPAPQPTRTGTTVRVLNRHGRFVTISRKEAADGAFHNQRFH